MKEKVCCFTGHRRVSPKMLEELNEYLPSVLRELIEDGYTVFRAGGALGFDTYAAIHVLKLKKEYPNIRLELCLPCPDQTKKWSRRDVELYHRILEAADSYSYISDNYFVGCMQARNRCLVDGASHCVAYYDGSGKGGTAYTVRYSDQKNVPVTNVYLPLSRKCIELYGADSI